ncbi:MAG: 4-hydroxy-tetrahydrodipicolinate reductase [Actinomycetota bacterium]|nr:4-hydroxy-tetrahydrodipicolinate reductase [Actinomycetota bacterium]
MRVGVIGAGGRMGGLVCSAVEGDGDLDLVATVRRGDPLDLLTRAGAEAAVDFTVPTAVRDNVMWCLKHDVHAVVGTSGLGPSDLAEIERAARSSAARVLVAPNFALGAVLMMAFARRAAHYFERAEIVERHHEGKLDAPSGTALRTASLMAAEGGMKALDDGTEASVGARGVDGGGVRIHSLRLPGSVAHQEVIFGGDGETRTIRHDSLDRRSFMPGVLLGLKRVGTLDGLTVGLEHLLDT